MLFTLFTNRTSLAAGIQQPMSAAATMPAAPQANMVRLALGDSHTCTGTTEGAIWCWGLNGSGEVGDGTTTPAHLRLNCPGSPG